jgi:16S rRNA (adenine1518-N6/adenine1519-N6)-dimethyltransferase
VRKISPNVFHPVPNVESALVVLRRVSAPPDPALVRLVHEAFAHRRKALAGSLALAPDGEPGIRERARDALEAIGQPADARAERLAPADFVALEARLG